ncbi:MAG: Gfo/Idh/MocA family protein [Candidatus Bipolaricaulia bacterium]
MSNQTIHIGIIGTGFGRRVMLPAFAVCEGAEVVAVCSARRENAEAAAREYGISSIYTDYEAMMDHEDLDLVAITTPPHLHWPMTKSALEHKLHVLCEKPTALNLEEARQMYNRAQQAEVVHLIDHELRFNPTLLNLKQLIDSGYLGAPGNVSFSIRGHYPMVMDPKRPWDWWFDAARGGGLLGAAGSHYIDLLRWLLGEFRRVSGCLHTFVKERPLADSDKMKPVTSDDYCTFMAELECGAIGTITLDATVRIRPQDGLWLVAFHGEAGSLLWDGQARLWGLRDDQETEVEELTQPDPATEMPGLSEGVFPPSFVHFSRRIVEALQNGKKTVAGAATFYDGMRVQAVLDAVRRSHEQGGWVKCSVP